MFTDEKPKSLYGLPTMSWPEKRTVDLSDWHPDPAKYRRAFEDTCNQLDMYMEKVGICKKKVS